MSSCRFQTFTCSMGKSRLVPKTLVVFDGAFRNWYSQNKVGCHTAKYNNNWVFKYNILQWVMRSFFHPEIKKKAPKFLAEHTSQI